MGGREGVGAWVVLSLSPGNQGERGGAGLFVSWEPAHPLPVGSPFFPSKSSSKD